MKTGILSLHERFADAIFSGKKHYEYRRKAPAVQMPTRFLIYVTSPRKEMVGEIIVDHILSDTPSAVWKRTGEHGGIPKQDYFEYFEGASRAHALHVQSYKTYRNAVPLDELRKKLPGGFTPPQYLSWLTPSRMSPLQALTRK